MSSFHTLEKRKKVPGSPPDSRKIRHRMLPVGDQFTQLDTGSPTHALAVEEAD